MKKSIKFSLFPSASGSYPIRMRVTFSGVRIDVRTGYSIEPDKWLSSEERVKRNARNRFGQPASEINAAIDRMREKAEAAFERMEESGTSVTPGLIRKEISGESEREQMATLDDCFSSFIKEVGKTNEWSQRTLQKYESLRKHLQHFNPDIRISELSVGDLTGFVEYLNKLDLKNSSVAKYVMVLRSFLRWEYVNGKIASDLNQRFRVRIKTADREVIYLEWDELMKLLDFDFGSKRLSGERDVFCFCCFTGLRYSDVKRLRWADVSDDAIHIVTRKTSDSLVINLNDYSRRILNKYAGIRLPGGCCLPVISNARSNDYIKEACRIAGISRMQRIVYYKGSIRHDELYPTYSLITTHCARRTFVVNALRLGIPAEVIMSWTGHKNYQAMRPYVKIVDELKASEMEKFDKIGKPKKEPKNPTFKPTEIGGFPISQN